MLENLAPIEIFDDNIPRELREQIIRYQMSAMLSDVERARLFGLPNTSRMREGAKIISPDKLICGQYVWIGEGAILDASGGLEIGDHTSIGLSVFIWTHSSHMLNREMANKPNSPKIEHKSSKIGSGCFISGPSVILPGINIGNRAIISPLSVVDRDVKDGEIFSKNRELNKRLRKLEKEIERLKETREK